MHQTSSNRARSEPATAVVRVSILLYRSDRLRYRTGTHPTLLQTAHLSVLLRQRRLWVFRPEHWFRNGFTWLNQGWMTSWSAEANSKDAKPQLRAYRRFSGLGVRRYQKSRLRVRGNTHIGTHRLGLGRSIRLANYSARALPAT
jgi:hypothetical protein